MEAMEDKALCETFKCYVRVLFQDFGMGWSHIYSEYFGPVRADKLTVSQGRSSFTLGFLGYSLTCSWGFQVWEHAEFSTVTHL